MTHVACESKLRLVVRSSMHPCAGNLLAIRRAVVYYAQAFSTRVRCRHCRCLFTMPLSRPRLVATEVSL